MFEYCFSENYNLPKLIDCNSRLNISRRFHTPKSRMCIAERISLIYLNDITNQDMSPAIQTTESDVRL